MPDTDRPLANWLHKILDGANIKLASVASAVS
jgi:hypothetical protein